MFGSGVPGGSFVVDHKAMARGRFAQRGRTPYSIAATQGSGIRGFRVIRGFARDRPATSCET